MRSHLKIRSTRGGRAEWLAGITALALMLAGSTSAHADCFAIPTSTCYSTTSILTSFDSCYSTAIPTTTVFSPVYSSLVVPSSVVSTSYIQSSYYSVPTSTRVLTTFNDRLYYVRPTSVLRPTSVIVPTAVTRRVIVPTSRVIVPTTQVIRDVPAETVIYETSAASSCYSSSVISEERVVSDEPVIRRVAPSMPSGESLRSSSPEPRDPVLNPQQSFEDLLDGPSSPPPAQPADEVDSRPLPPQAQPSEGADGGFSTDELPFPSNPGASQTSTVRRRSLRPVTRTVVMPMLTLRVIDQETGQAVRGVPILAVPVGSNEYQPRKKSTDSQGLVDIPLPSGDWSLRVLMPSGSYRSLRNVVFTVDEDILFADGTRVPDVVEIGR